MEDIEVFEESKTFYKSNNPLKFWFFVLKRSLDFKTRSPRKEFWMFYLGNIIVFLILLVLLTLVLYISKNADYAKLVMIYSTFIMIWRIVLLLPALALQTRRFHDLNKSGLFTVLFFICNFLLGYLSSFFGHIPQNNHDFLVFSILFIVCLLVDIWLFILLGFVKGSSQENKYGKNPLV